MKFHAPKEENLDFILGVNGIKEKKTTLSGLRDLCQPLRPPPPQGDRRPGHLRPEAVAGGGDLAGGVGRCHQGVP